MAMISANVGSSVGVDVELVGGDFNMVGLCPVTNLQLMFASATMTFP